jgi:hypothetical protein
MFISPASHVPTKDVSYLLFLSSDEMVPSHFSPVLLVTFSKEPLTDERI